MRSRAWSKTFPNRLDVNVTRASLPSTVSRNVISQPHAKPNANQPFQKSTPAAIASSQLNAVTVFGWISARASTRTTAAAGRGQSHLVIRSVDTLVG